ncbi:GroES-like protein [Aspergillus steynii IBT 23096]|uniref:GroES-like protein n=1 Tax=Aspergillus steynii IBT 23096 TaxID=1392250 RepID=A0A2I2FT44_9EURO|nr:GroES-like protein [Aspergillus steynii IBT 23096]PLB43747.1 GroES-like protein [Aspergillus steynii IBT 23096]
MQPALPANHRALVLESRDSGCQIKTVPTPQPDNGSAVVRIAVAGILPYHRDVYNGKRPNPFPTPLVGGFGAIGHVAAVGSDATALTPGQFVYVDCVIRARDDPDAYFLTAIYEGSSNGSKRLMRDVWRNGTFAEYAKVPLENCIPLDEARLCRGLGYTVPDLMYMAYMLVPYGGLRDIQLEPGETIIVCPATGFYGSLGVQMAAAMGARVIAMGRSEEKLAKLKADVTERSPGADIETVTITNDPAQDVGALRAFGTIDAVLDITPSSASSSTHTKSAIKALRHGGRVSLMGSTANIGAPEIMVNNITLKGKMMYQREAIVHFVKMLERGLLPLGKDCMETKAFSLDNWEEGFDYIINKPYAFRASIFL